MECRQFGCEALTNEIGRHSWSLLRLVLQPWSLESHVKLNQELNITKSYLSITSPGTHLRDGDNALGRKVARECNEHAAGVKKEMPDMFGFWASLPLPDIEGSLAELEYVFDHLNADGESDKLLRPSSVLRSRHFSRHRTRDKLSWQIPRSPRPTSGLHRTQPKEGDRFHSSNL